MPTTILNNKPLFYTDTPQSQPTPPLTTLLIHGLGASSSIFQTIIPGNGISTLTRCIAFDYPGSGLSQMREEELSINGLAKIAMDLLDSLNVTEKVVVVGHSMGGIVASEIAAVYRERVKGVVLLGPVDPGIGSLEEVFGKRIKVIRKEGNIEALANVTPQIATGSKSTLLHHAFIRSLVLSTTPEAYIALCYAIMNAKRPDYQRIRVPLLIVNGTDEKLPDFETCEGVKGMYGTGEGQKSILVLEGVGHWHCVEDGEGVRKGVLGWLGEWFGKV